MIDTDISIGRIRCYFPKLSGVNNDNRTNEWFFSLEHNIAWAWRWLGYEGKDGILNPTFAFYQDTHSSGSIPPVRFGVRWAKPTWRMSFTAV